LNGEALPRQASSIYEKCNFKSSKKKQKEAKRRPLTQLTLQDKGHGFDQDTDKRGLGFSTIREQIELSGGICTIES
jgi:signal transduction histidine kinase